MDTLTYLGCEGFALIFLTTGTFWLGGIEPLLVVPALDSLE